MVQMNTLRLKDRYPMIRYDMADSGKEKPIFDNFYIDFNAIVYQCIRVLLGSSSKAAVSSKIR